MAMKSFIFALAVLMVSCQAGSDDQLSTPTPSPEVPDTPSERVFRGIIAEEDGSRVFLDEKVRLHWNADDRITLFEGTTRNKQYKFMGEDGDNAGDFEFVKAGFGTGNDLDRYYALYPYASTTKYKYDNVADYIQFTLPATQTYAESSVGRGANVMVAVTADLEDFDLLFRNACSFLLVRLWGVEQTVGSVTLTTNAGEPIAGTCKITPVYGGYPTLEMTGTTSSVTLNCVESVQIGTTEQTATDFWIVVPPATYSQGISVKVSGYYGGEQTFTVDKSLTFERNKYKRLIRELSITDASTAMGVNGWNNNGVEHSGAAE